MSRRLPVIRIETPERDVLGTAKVNEADASTLSLDLAAEIASETAFVEPANTGMDWGSLATSPVGVGLAGLVFGVVLAAAGLNMVSKRKSAKAAQDEAHAQAELKAQAKAASPQKQVVAEAKASAVVSPVVAKVSPKSRLAMLDDAADAAASKALASALGIKGEARQAVEQLAEMVGADATAVMVCPSVFDKAQAELRVGSSAGEAVGVGVGGVSGAPVSDDQMRKLRRTLFPDERQL